MRLVLALTLAMVASGGYATTVYQWTDPSGQVHFTDEPPPAGVEAQRLRLQGQQSSRSAAPSERVREIRCRDFRGALEQLQTAEGVDPSDARWLEAKELARARITQWCPDP